MQLALVKWMPAQMKAWLANCSAGVSPAKSKPCNCHSCLDRTAPRTKMRYGLGNGRSRVLVRNIRQLSFFVISRHGKLAIGNRVEAYTCHSAGNFYRVSQAAGAMLACRVFLANDHPHPDWQAGEIAKVGHFRIS